MGRPRSELHEILKTMASYVYFQPPTNITMQYPCIVYNRDVANTTFADNFPHRIDQKYTITVIDRNPDSAIPSLVAALQMCIHNRFFTADNLNHDVYNLYF